MFLVVDLAFLTANGNKFGHGGWFPVLLGALLFSIMSTWWRGRWAANLTGSTVPVDLFWRREDRLPRVPGTAVSSLDAHSIPPVLLHHVSTTGAARAGVLLSSDRAGAERRSGTTSRWRTPPGFYRVTARYGFMQTPHVPRLLACYGRGPGSGPRRHHLLLGRETLLPDGPSRMAGWRKRLFIVMARNAQTASTFFGLPPNRVVEMGAQIQL
jgi:KUP system potassium uptake protein